MLTLVLMGVWGLQAQDIPYGYAPHDANAKDLQIQGSGKNNYMEVAFMLDPQSDPAFKRMEGHSIKGVRIYLTSDYHQKKKGFSSIKIYKGALGGKEIARTLVNFDKGWNEVSFEQPVTIEAGQKYYVSAEVFELLSSPYPFVCYPKNTMPGSFFSNVARSSQWMDYSQRGSLMMQAIIDASSEMDHTVSGLLMEHPTLVLPSSAFESTVYFKNYSSQSVKKIIYDVLCEGQKVSDGSYEFEQPLEAFDGRLVSLPITTGSKQGDELAYSIHVTQIDGQSAQMAVEPITSLYVTDDAFRRVVMIEEFTSQFCPSCPFMSYYLTKAKHEAAKPYVFVTHHVGFQSDSFTQPVDQPLLFFFQGSTFNPAAMFNRSVLKGMQSPIIGAKHASEEPYIDNINSAYAMPAMAKVLVDVVKNDNTWDCTVHGRISRFATKDGKACYLSAYLVEDSISFDRYSQKGLDTQGAPEDLKAVLGGHSGIIRAVLNKTITGDLLSVDGENAFSVTYSALQMDPSWNKNNCHIVAFVHRFNDQDIRDNEVLNAGSDALNGYVLSVDQIGDNSLPLQLYVEDGYIKSKDNLDYSLRVYDLNGVLHNISNKLLPGIYIVSDVTMKYQPTKIEVK